MESLHDTPPVADHMKGTAVYMWDTWRLEIQYQNDVVASLTFTKIEPMNQPEIFSILDQNGGMSRWHVTAPINNHSGSWTRADGATAVYAADTVTRKETLKLQGGSASAAIASALPTTAPDKVLVTVPYRDGVTPPKPNVEQPSAQSGNTTITPPTANNPAAANSTAPAVTAPAASTTSAAPAGSAGAPVAPVMPPVVNVPVPVGEGPASKMPITLPAPPPPHHWLPPALGFLEPYLVVNQRNGIILGGAFIALALLLKLAQSGRAKNPAQPLQKQQKLPPPFAGDRGAGGLESLTWRHFESLLGEVFRRRGYEVESSTGDADGVEMRLRGEDGLTLVHCKFWSNAKVSVVAVREFASVMAHAEAARGVFICTGDFMPDARAYAEEMPIELLDRAGVKALIASITRPGEDICNVARQLPEFAS